MISAPILVNYVASTLYYSIVTTETITSCVCVWVVSRETKAYHVSTCNLFYHLPLL